MDDINEHKAQGTFSLTAHLEGRGYPTKDVTVFTDAESAFALAEINERLEALANDRSRMLKAAKEAAAEEADLLRQEAKDRREAITAAEQSTKRTKAFKDLVKEYDALEAQADELREKVKESRLEFHLRGISPGHLNKIRKDIIKQAEKDESDPDELGTLVSNAWIAPQIISVTNAAGDKDEHVFTTDEVATIRDLLPESQWAKLDEAVSDLSFKSHYIDAAVDPGFLPRS
jgi:myosin heavy subunit